MKKTLFSLAFLAASGAYVAAANHVFGPLQDGSSAVALNTPGPAGISSALAEPVFTSALPATLSPMSPATPSQTVANTAPAALPPLPRARPTVPTPVTEPAASARIAASGTTGLRDGTYTGTDENAYYGRVRVQVTVLSRQITAVTVLDYPQDRRTSRYINSQALPMLKREVIAADSADIDIISGATLTSEAYIRSLRNALKQARGSNA